MANPSERQPDISTARNFALPEFPAEQAEIIETAFDLEHYTSAPLITASWRQVVFGAKTPEGTQGPYATSGFVIHTAEVLDKGTSSEMLIAPPPGLSEKKFLRYCIRSLDLAMPTREDFPVPVRRVGTAMTRVGIKAIVGFSLNTDLKDPDVNFPSLLLPRLLLSGEFKNTTDPEEPVEFGIKLGAATFALLSMQQLRAMGEEESL